MKLTDDVRTALAAARIQDNALVLQGQLARPLYVRVNQVLEELGGRWSRKARAHLFEGDPRGVIAEALDRGAVSTARDMGWFPTPPALAAELVERAGVRPGSVVVEPSAGEGAIVAALRRVGATVAAVELHAGRAAMLRQRFPEVQVVQRDFLDTHPMLLPHADAVVMNPPFSVEGHAQADIAHVGHALDCVKRGGSLVAVMAAGVTFRQNAATVAFRAKVEAMGGRFEQLPDGAFSSAGTDVCAVVLTIPEVR